MEEREIAASKLGTQNYWNEFYSLELNNYNDTSDQGEIWFGKGLLKRVCKWIEKSNLMNCDKSVLDLGCGNGLFLFEMAKLNFKFLRGIDYSAKSIQLSNSILQHDYADIQSDIKFKQLNILESIDQQIEDHENWKSFDLIFDKGTYDAICLNPDRNFTLDELKARYRSFLNSVLSSSGLFILCSCNWSREELIKDFIDDADILRFDLIDEIKQGPSFTFASIAGNTVTCLIFRRKHGEISIHSNTISKKEVFTN